MSRMRAGRLAGVVAAFAALAALLPPRTAAAMSIVHTAAVPKGPAAIAFDPLTHLAYVGSVTEDAISVFAGAVKVGEIARAGLNPAGLAVDAAGARLIVASHASDRVDVYGTADLRLARSVAVPGRPWGVAVEPSTGDAYVARFALGTLAVIGRDGALADVALPGCAGPIGVAYADPVRRVLVTCVYSGTVHVVDPATRDHVAAVTVGAGLGVYPWGIGCASRTATCYVANWSGGSPTKGTIAVFDAAAAAVTGIAFTGGAPIGVAVSSGGTPYATLSATHRLAALDPATGGIVETIELPRDPSTPGEENNPQAVAVHPTGRVAIVGNFHAESVSFVNTLPHL